MKIDGNYTISERRKLFTGVTEDRERSSSLRQDSKLTEDGFVSGGVRIKRAGKIHSRIDFSGGQLIKLPRLDWRRINGDINAAERQARPLFCGDQSTTMEFIQRRMVSKLQTEYSTWYQNQAEDSTEGINNLMFINGLQQELLLDLATVEDEEYCLLNFADEPGRWEFQYLDNGGGTTRIVRELADGNGIFWADKAREKYRHLAPRDEIWEWEHLYLNKENGGTTRIEE